MERYPYVVLLSNGDWAYAFTWDGLALAARTICREAREIGWSGTARILVDGAAVAEDRRGDRAVSIAREREERARDIIETEGKGQ